jgi:hypothetical protein
MTTLHPKRRSYGIKGQIPPALVLSLYFLLSLLNPNSDYSPPAAPEAATAIPDEEKKHRTADLSFLCLLYPLNKFKGANFN